MKEGFLLKKIRTGGIALLIIGLVVAAFGVIGLYADEDGNLNRLLYGPKPVNLAEVLASPESIQGVIRITPDEIFQSGYVQSTDDKTTEEYLYLLQGESVLIAEVPYDDNGYDAESFTGTLADAPYEVHEGLLEETDGSGLMVSDLMLEATGSLFGALVYCLFFAAIAGTGLFFIVKGVLRISRPASHPALKRLGADSDIDLVIERVERDACTHGHRVGQSVCIGRDYYLTGLSGLSLTINRIEDIFWAYRKVTRTKAYGLVTVAKNHAVVTGVRGGKLIEATMREKQVDEVLLALQERNARIVPGYSAQLQVLWQKNWQAFETLLADIRPRMASEADTAE